MSTPGFLELQLDPLYSQGSKGSPGYTTTVVSNDSQVNDTRFPKTTRGYWRLEIAFDQNGSKSKAQMQAIQDVFTACMGKAYGFRFRNWRDYQITNELQTLFTGGTSFQLSRRRGVNTPRPETVPIRKPDMSNNLTLTRDIGDGKGPQPFIAFTLDTTTGIVTFTSSQNNTYLFYATCTYDIPVRFDIDEADITWEDANIMSLSGVKLLEIQV